MILSKTVAEKTARYILSHSAVNKTEKRFKDNIEGIILTMV